MVELKPSEYKAVCEVIGPEMLDMLAGNAETTAQFWTHLQATLRPAERQRLRELLTLPRPS